MWRFTTITEMHFIFLFLSNACDIILVSLPSLKSMVLTLKQVQRWWGSGCTTSWLFCLLKLTKVPCLLVSCTVFYRSQNHLYNMFLDVYKSLIFYYRKLQRPPEGVGGGVYFDWQLCQHHHLFAALTVSLWWQCAHGLLVTGDWS